MTLVNAPISNSTSKTKKHDIRNPEFKHSNDRIDSKQLEYMSCPKKQLTEFTYKIIKIPNTEIPHPIGGYGEWMRSDHDCCFEVPTPALITLGRLSLPMLKSIPIALPARRITKMVTLAIRKNGELISSFWQATPPHWIFLTEPSLPLTVVCRHLQA